MKERGILMCAEMVVAMLEDRKSQTRRVVKDRIVPIVEECFRVNGKWCNHTFDYDLVELCPYGQIGQHLYVKETFGIIPEDGGTYVYRATDPEWGTECGLKWKPSIFMPRVASRITLEITDISVERVQSITEEDAIAEGVTAGGRFPMSARGTYSDLWDKINFKRDNGRFGWVNDPWVWKISFRRIKP